MFFWASVLTHINIRVPETPTCNTSHDSAHKAYLPLPCQSALFEQNRFAHKNPIAIRLPLGALFATKTERLGPVSRSEGVAKVPGGVVPECGGDRAADTRTDVPRGADT